MAVSTEIRAPGVYLEEVVRRPAPAFETGVPAFLGRLSKAGEDLPPFAGGRRVVALDLASWSALEQRAGLAWAAGYVGFAVRGFFENGGRRCHLVVVGDGEPAAAFDAALAALDAVEDFDLVCAPDAAPRLATTDGAPLGPADAHARIARFCDRRTGCFAILDAVGAGLASAALTPGRMKSAVLPAARTVNAAIYGPWIKVRGACPACGGAGVSGGAPCGGCAGTGQGFVPPSGHVAGVYARVDRAIGVHKAPANEAVEGALDLALHLDDAAIADLQRAGVDVVRALPGRGVRVWGARTLVPEHPDFAHVNARRVFLTAARWLEQRMEGAAFEPNDLRLWARIGREVGAYLEELYRRGALQGAAMADAFYVKCDAETNPPSVRDAGQVVAEVGLALSRPNEFVVVRLISGAPRAAPG